MRVAVVGASGYAGQEVLRLAGSHPQMDVVLASGESAAGTSIARHAPSLAALYPDASFSRTEEVLSADLDAVFLALPHGQSQRWVPQLVDSGVAVFDLGADFRLVDPGLYEEWYGARHEAPALLSRSVYGLVERHRDELVGARLVAVPGCYPTASALALGPFLDANVVERQGIVVNALSGASGAGRAVSDRLHFSRLSANAEAYALLRHRHTPEMQQELGAELLFTPHIVPVARGMLVTAYARLSDRALNTEAAMGLLREAYAGEAFIVVSDEAPTMKDPVGSNLCFVSARVDERTGWLVAMSSIDNLVKGAAGQAVQAFNVAMGIAETVGLPRVGITP